MNFQPNILMVVDKNAAGGASKESLEETLDKVKSAIKTYSEYL